MTTSDAHLFKERTLVTDDWHVANRIFACSARNKEYFEFFRQVFSTMDEMTYELTAGRKPYELKQAYGMFIRTHYKTDAVLDNWRLVERMYESGIAPLVSEPSVDISAEAHDAQTVLAFLGFNKLPQNEISPTLKAFTSLLSQVKRSEAHVHFDLARKNLETTCVIYAKNYGQHEVAKMKDDPDAVLRAQEERVSRVRRAFALSKGAALGAAAPEMLSLMLDKSDASPVPFFAGLGAESLDAATHGGMPRHGLMTIVGGTSGGKTLSMSCLPVNHVIEAYRRGEKAPNIWIYVAEDGVETYVWRMLSNLSNRLWFNPDHDMPFMTIRDLDVLPDSVRRGFRPVFQGSMNELKAIYKGRESFYDYVTGKMEKLSKEQLEADAQIREAVMLIHQHFLAGVTIWKNPKDPQEKLKFNVVNLLSQFDAAIDAAPSEKPLFIIIDYLNLLRGGPMLGENRTQELNSIAHFFDEWAADRRTLIVTAIQAGVDGIDSMEQNLRPLSIKDLYEAKGVSHSSRMLLSVMPYTNYVEQDGKIVEVRELLIKVLKNRTGKKGVLIVTDLDEARNITFTESLTITSKQWAEKAAKILEHVNAGESAGGLPIGPGRGAPRGAFRLQGQPFGRSAQGPRGGQGSQAPKGGQTRATAAPPMPDTSDSAF